MAMPLDQDRARTDGLVLRRCHDPVAMEEILRRDAFDIPFPYMPRSLLRRAVRELLAPSRDVYFVTVELKGEKAGFVFGHTLGPTLWRKFARAQLTRHPFAIAWLVFRLKVLLALRRKLGGWFRRQQRPAEDPASRVQGLDVPRVDRPFAWSEERQGTGQVDILLVRAAFRGFGLAPQLLEYLSAEMAQQGVTLIEAHVDAWNLASVCAFLKAGWEAVQTSGGDFHVCYHPLGESRTGQQG